MPRGRPAGSQVRQNIVEILNYGGKLHGYGIFSVYKALFPKAGIRNVYYHLKKGIETGELKVAEVRKESGNYSWGGYVERRYYALGPNAKPAGLPEVKEYFESGRAVQTRNSAESQG